MSRRSTETEKPYITDPTHGGKITCHKCVAFIREGETWFQYSVGVFFHRKCFNRYEHYYGLDKAID